MVVVRLAVLDLLRNNIFISSVVYVKDNTYYILIQPTDYMLPTLPISQ